MGSAYEAFGDTCAGRRPAGTLPYPTQVFSDTVVQQTSATKNPKDIATDKEGVTSTTVAAPSVPPTDPDLASRILAVDGYTIAEMPADDVLWRPFDESIPADLTRHHALVVAADGTPVAHLVVAATTAIARRSTRSSSTPSPTTCFSRPIVETDEGTFTTMNSAAPVWTEMEGNAVIVAEQETDGNFQWAWSADDAVWIVRGKRMPRTTCVACSGCTPPTWILTTSRE